MPAAAVIPAPIAYTKFVAVKTLVVGIGLGGWWNSLYRGFLLASALFLQCLSLLLAEWGAELGSFTVKKLECFKQVIRS